MSQIPVIDLKSFIETRNPSVPREIARSCADFGFFCIRNHGVSVELQNRLAKLSHEFFSQAEDEKMKIDMKKGGVAWRGYFPVLGELTSGRPDLKEGLYFGEELGEVDPRVQKRWPLHGANLFPNQPSELRETVLEYIEAMTELGHLLMEAISIGLDLPADYFLKNYTRRPTPLFRIFHYPPSKPKTEKDIDWGVGEHTDYGLLTILAQDDVGGLQVKTQQGWINIPPQPNVFVCNVGDMLDFLSGGRYLSAPHRVVNISGRSRYSYPFFFDPDFAAKVKPLPVAAGFVPKPNERWDKQNLYAFNGTYGEYLMGKVSNVFPDLAKMQF